MAVFFIVFSPQGEAPARKTYATHPAAFAEAHRLAKMFPSQQFFVMQSKSRAIAVPGVQEADHD